MPRQPSTVTIDVETCKGCVLCVEVCPPKVLVMSELTNAMGYRYPLLLDGCTGCELCYKICPDFCFEVYRARHVCCSKGAMRSLRQRSRPAAASSPAIP